MAKADFEAPAESVPGSVCAEYIMHYAGSARAGAGWQGVLLRLPRGV